MRNWFYLSPLLLVGCIATTPVKPQLMINALVIENNSLTELHNVKIKVEQTGAYGSCSLVLLGRACSTTFPTKIYQGNPVFLTWEIQGQPRQVGPLYVQNSERIQVGRDAAVVINFQSINDVTVKFRY
ncbi:hypothetical protein A9Q78_07505 [Methylophaga sp. 41_12_T18]|nr:hypothetical protein A9Q78_07505 [Methylophaga sp. 41_12_T18]